MRGKTKAILATAVTAIGVAACSVQSTGPATVNLSEVLYRTVDAAEAFQTYLRDNNVTGVTRMHENELAMRLRTAYNTSPPVVQGGVEVSIRSDASILGFDDVNRNGLKEPGEPDYFLVEIDAERGRLIASDVGGTSESYRVSSNGFFTGYIVGRLMSRQGRAGITSASFASRNTVDRTGYVGKRTTVKAGARPSKTASTDRARSRARTGGARIGK